MTKKTIGIIGGMGPMATCDLMEKIIRVTNAPTDQDNIHMVVDCNTNIPDRTSAILRGTQSPVPQLVRSGIKLQAMGADVLIMPCNTAHFFYDEITPYFDIPLLHMIRETAGELKRRGISKAGLLATDGTIQAGVYRKPMEEAGIELVTPQGEDQKAVMGIIYDGVKAGKRDYPTGGFEKTMKSLLDAGCETLILGCTELPVAMTMYHLDYPCVDPTLVLAEAAVAWAMKESIQE